MQVDIFSEFSHPTLGTVVELGIVLDVVIRLRHELEKDIRTAASDSQELAHLYPLASERV